MILPRLGNCTPVTIYAIRDKKRVCSDQKSTRAQKIYPGSAQLAQYILHVCVHCLGNDAHLYMETDILESLLCCYEKVVWIAIYTYY